MSKSNSFIFSKKWTPSVLQSFRKLWLLACTSPMETLFLQARNSQAYRSQKRLAQEGKSGLDTDCNLKVKDGVLIFPPCDYGSDDCPPFNHGTREFDPHNPPQPRYPPDPRPRLPCVSTCCQCRPAPRPKKPNVPTLKLRQLADCYSCRVSPGCHNRRKTFYQRWQTYLDRLPRRYPNTDYSVKCCDDYVDLSINNDFFKWDTHLDLRPGPRTEALRNFLWMKNLSSANYDVKQPMYECWPHEPWLRYTPPKMLDSPGMMLEKKHDLYHEDAITLWRDLASRPEYKNWTEGKTPHRSYITPFKKDTSFTNPLDTFTSFSSGNDPPFKEFREVKKAM